MTRTTWRVVNDWRGLGDDRPGPHVTVEVSTDDPAVVAVIERAARDAGVQLLAELDLGPDRDGPGVDTDRKGFA